ncbi:GFA family protein [Jannaschia sp. LMIT008]|uniref:GFA family protein n=1 Tax=Jannaschia maritima TaxID=3032585 RepID=UPI002810D4C4|nr:GFA family protein [Jannaschia sp. LMIT008]
MSDIRDPHRRTGRLDGRCLCGAVRIVIDGDHVAGVGACHCTMCRRWSGLVYGTFDVARDAVAATGPVVRYRSSENAVRAFCGTYGSHLWMEMPDEPHAPYEMIPGPFEGTRDFPLISEIYVDRRPAHVPLTGDHRTRTRAEYEAGAFHIEGDDP